MDDKRPVKFEAHLVWKGAKANIIKDVIGYRLEDEVYFFFSETPDFPDDHQTRTAWIKHPELRSVKIIPVEYL